MSVDHKGQGLCTTNGETVEAVRKAQIAETGQHSGYIVLCAEERAKGFVRPYRDQYKHAGRMTEIVNDAGDHVTTHRLGGCGATTLMGRSLSETYARDPSFYGKTFCVHCNAHFPVEEFTWTADGMQVGS